MRSVFEPAICFVVCLSAVTTTEAGVIYDAAADFSKTSNPNGVWSYGETPSLGGAFQLYASFGPDTVDPPNAQLLDTWYNGGSYAPPSVFHNGSSDVVAFASVSIAPGQLGFHPGSAGQYSVVRFTAPSLGTYALSSLFSPLDLFTTTDVHVLLNGNSLFDSLVSTNATPYNSTIAMAVGDHLDFAVGFGNGDFFSDSTGLSVTLAETSAVPEPSSMAILGVSGIGMAIGARSRRRKVNRASLL